MEISGFLIIPKEMGQEKYLIKCIDGFEYWCYIIFDQSFLAKT